MAQAVARKPAHVLALHTSPCSTSEKSSLERNPGSCAEDGGVLQAGATFPSMSSSYMLWSHTANPKPQRQLWFVCNKTGCRCPWVSQLWFVCNKTGRRCPWVSWSGRSHCLPSVTPLQTSRSGTARRIGKSIFQQGVGSELHPAAMPGSRHAATNVSHFPQTLQCTDI